jgi:hypothetical protein
MSRWARPRTVVVAVAVAIGTFVLPQLLVFAGAPVELVGALSVVSLAALAVAAVLLVAMSAARTDWAIALAAIAAVAEVAAGLLLLIHEPQPAYLHPEWAWYWPVVNTLYVGGFVVALVALLGSVVSALGTRAGRSFAAIAIAVAALAANRIAPYR